MATKQAVQKVLRLGIIQNGRVVEERLLRTREPVRVGQKLSNTFVVASSAFPVSFTMFDVKGGNYVLHFTDQMVGRILLGSSVHDLDSLKKSGKATKTAEGWALELAPTARGKIGLGDATILFQFVTPPPLRVLPQLPANMRGGLLLFAATTMGLQGAFLASLLFSTVVQVGAVVWLVFMVPPGQRVVGIGAMPDRFVQILEPKETPPVETVTELSEDGEPTDAEPAEEEGEAEEAQEAGEASSRTENTVREQAEQRVRQESALAAFYGGGENADGPVLGFTTALTDRRADEVLSNQTALGENVGTGGIVSRTGLGTSSGAEGAVGRAQVEGGGSRVAEGATTERSETREAATVRVNVRAGSARTAGTGTLDQNSVSSVIRRRMSDIERCYERALAQDPSLRGRVMVQFTIGEGGRVTDARLPENTVGDAVGSCIVGRVRRWRFDEPQGGNVVVRYPFILEPGS